MPFAPPSATGLRCLVSNDQTARGWSCLSAEPDKRGSDPLPAHLSRTRSGAPWAGSIRGSQCGGLRRAAVTNPTASATTTGSCGRPRGVSARSAPGV